MLFVYELMIFSLFIIPFIHYRVIKEKNWKTTIDELLPHNKNLFKEIVGGITLFFLLFIGFILIAMIMTIIQNFTGFIINDLDKVADIISLEISASLIGFILLVGIVVFIEELFFRAFLIRKIGVLSATIIFTIFHIGYGSIAQIIGVFLLGLILAYWFKKNESILQNYLGHLLYNLVAILLYLIF